MAIVFQVVVDNVLLFDEGDSPQALLGHPPSCQNGASQHCYFCVTAVINIGLILIEGGEVALFNKLAHAKKAVGDAWYCMPLSCPFMYEEMKIYHLPSIIFRRFLDTFTKVDDD